MKREINFIDVAIIIAIVLLVEAIAVGIANSSRKSDHTSDIQYNEEIKELKSEVKELKIEIGSLEAKLNSINIPDDTDEVDEDGID